MVLKSPEKVMNFDCVIWVGTLEVIWICHASSLVTILVTGKLTEIPGCIGYTQWRL